MSNIAVRIGVAGCFAIALTACGKGEEKKGEITPRPVSEASVAAPEGKQKVEGDAAAA